MSAEQTQAWHDALACVLRDFQQPTPVSLRLEVDADQDDGPG